MKNFYKHLTLTPITCDIHPTQVVNRWCIEDNLKLSQVAEYAILSDIANRDKNIIRYHSIDYSARGPQLSFEGMRRGAGAFVHEVAGGVQDLVAKPARGFKEAGLTGAAMGALKGIGGFIFGPTRGMIL